MTREYPVMIEGQLHYVIVSDDREALLAAKAAGKASVGLWQNGESQGWLPADHVIESVEDVDRVSGAGGAQTSGPSVGHNRDKEADAAGI